MEFAWSLHEWAREAAIVTLGCKMYMFLNIWMVIHGKVPSRVTSKVTVAALYSSCSVVGITCQLSWLYIMSL